MTCKLTDHTWQPNPRASSPSVMLPGALVPATCTACGTRYPCKHACDHLDCRLERGDALPAWVTPVLEATPAEISPLEAVDPALASNPIVTPELPEADGETS